MSRRSRAAARWLASVASLAGLCALADAQMAVNEASAAAPFGAPIEDQSIFFHAELDQFEERLDAGANALRWMELCGSAAMKTGYGSRVKALYQRD